MSGNHKSQKDFLLVGELKLATGVKMFSKPLFFSCMSLQMFFKNRLLFVRVSLKKKLEAFSL